MLKRTRALILTMLYVSTVFGFALSLHFCADVLASVKIDAPAKSCKTLSGKKMKCCKDTQVTVKVKDAHQAEAPSFLKGLFVIELPWLAINNRGLAAQQSVLEKQAERGPPSVAPPGKVSVLVKNCTFRI
jgi:hypothetical protein